MRGLMERLAFAATLLALITTAVAAQQAPAAATPATLIVDVLTAPNQFWNKTITLAGHVASVAADPPGTNRGSYLFRDQSDREIEVLTTELPSPGTELVVVGIVRQFSLAQREPLLLETGRGPSVAELRQLPPAPSPARFAGARTTLAAGTSQETRSSQPKAATPTAGSAAATGQGEIKGGSGGQLPRADALPPVQKRGTRPPDTQPPRAGTAEPGAALPRAAGSVPPPEAAVPPAATLPARTEIPPPPPSPGAPGIPGAPVESGGTAPRTSAAAPLASFASPDGQGLVAFTARGATADLVLQTAPASWAPLLKAGDAWFTGTADAAAPTGVRRFKGTVYRVPLNNECPSLGRLHLDAVLTIDDATGTMTLTSDEARYQPDCRWNILGTPVSETWKKQ